MALHELYKNALLEDMDDVEVELEAVTAAEESYGEDYAWYGASAVEDDDEEDVSAIEAEQGVVFAGDDTDDLDAEIDRDLYGYEPTGGLEARFEATGMNAQQIGVLINAIGLGAMMPRAAQAGNAEKLIEFLHGTVTGGDLEEIATYIVTQPNAKDWVSLTQDQKYDIVASAIASSAIPGMELRADDAFWEAYTSAQNQGYNRLVAALSGAESAAVTYFTSDMPTFFQSMASEIPGLSQIALDKISDNPDEAINGVAFSYLMLHLVSKQLGPQYDTYNWLVQSIDQNAGQIFPAVSAAPDTGMSEAAPLIDILPPLSLSRGPRPQDILAGGVVLMNLLAYMGM